MLALKEAIGEKAFTELEEMIEDKIKLRSVNRDEFREVISRLDVLEHDVEDIKDDIQQCRLEVKSDINEVRKDMNERFDKINERFDFIHERFERMGNDFNSRFEKMNKDFNERFDSMYERMDKMYERMISLVIWTVGTIAVFGSIISILVGIGQFIK